MSLLGKLTFALLGFKFWGIIGLLWGLCIGHIFIDRTILSKKLFNKLNSFDDNIRLLLPYKYYIFYDKIITHIFGKIWGIIIGYIVFGWIGSLTFLFIGHFTFDLVDNPYIKKIKQRLKVLTNQNLIKLIGFTLGYTLESPTLIFTGIIIGYFIDNIRSDRGLITRIKPLNVFWPRINWLKLALTSKDSKNVAFVEAIAGLSANIAKADGEINSKEKKAFKKLFSESPNYQNLERIFENEKNKKTVDYQSFALQIKFITKNDLTLKEDVIDNLFKIIVSDSIISIEEIEIIKDISKIIALPDGNFAAIRKRYEIFTDEQSNSQKDYYKILGVSKLDSNNDIRIAWRKLTSQYHPDKIIAMGKSPEEVEMSNNMMAEINEAYQQIIKTRK